MGGTIEKNHSFSLISFMDNRWAHRCYMFKLSYSKQFYKICDEFPFWFLFPQYKNILFRWKMFACKVMAFPCIGLPHQLSTYIHNINTKNAMNLEWVRKQEWGLNVSIRINNHNANIHIFHQYYWLDIKYCNINRWNSFYFNW